MKKRYVVFVLCELLVFALLLTGCGSAKTQDFSESFELDGNQLTLNVTTNEQGYGLHDVDGGGQFRVSGGSAEVRCKVIGYDEAYEYSASHCMDDSYMAFSVGSDAEGFSFAENGSFYHVIPVNDDCSLLAVSSDEAALFAASEAISVSVR